MHWSEVAENVAGVITALAAIAAGFWTILMYQRSKRREAAQWMYEIFLKFQLAPEFDEPKQIFDFQYHDAVEPLHGALVAGSNAATSSDEWKTCHLIDRLLNLLEHLLYLSEAGHAKRSDCLAYFGYWFDLLSDPERGALRRYLVHFGYERLARFTCSSNEDFLLLYGSLTSGQPEFRAKGLDRDLRLIGERRIPGQLYDLGEYPGLVPGPGIVQAELYSFTDTSVLSRLDAFEECDRRNPNALYRRTTMRVDRDSDTSLSAGGSSGIDAWIYIYNRAVEGRPRIEGMSWKEHKAKRDRGSIQGTS